MYINDDKNLLKRLSLGDNQAFEALYDSMADRLLQYIYSRIQHRETSEEMVHDIFVSLWEKRESLEVRTNIESYLLGAAKNQILIHIRSEKVRRAYAQNLVAFLSTQLDNSTEELVDLEDMRALIEERVSELPAKCQTVFRMSRYEHKSIKTIAEEMNISTRTVENYITQALQHLRKSMSATSWLTFLVMLLFD